MVWAKTMKYPDGQEVLAGDQLSISPTSRGIVICDFDGHRCVEGFDWQSWAASLQSGVLVEAEQEGLIHLVTTDPDLVLLTRDYRASISFDPEIDKNKDRSQ